MALITLPGGMRFAQRTHWRLQTRTPSSGMGLDGRQQFLTREARSWSCSYQVEGGWDASADGAWGGWLAFLDDLRGPLNSFLLPVPNARTPYAAPGEVVFVTDWNGGFLYENGSGFVVGEGDPVAAADAPAGATILQLTGMSGDFLRRDAMFSISGWLHRVAENTDGTVRFNPPLRAPVTAGTTVKVGAPRVRVRLPSDEAAESAHAFSQLRGLYTLDVVEAFER